MFQPDDPLTPPGKVFDEPWQAQALALADGLVQQGHVPAPVWAEALGAALRDLESAGQPDTLDTYYKGVVAALEVVFENHTDVSGDMIADRRADWEEAYLNTPHGQPVMLKKET